MARRSEFDWYRVANFALALIPLSLWAGGLYIVAHFVIKYW